MRRPFIRLGAFSALVAAVLGCQQGQQAQKGAPPPAKVTIAQPVPYKFTPMGEYTGYLDAFRRVEIRPEVKGVLKAVHFTEGREIDAGVLLYEIDDTDYANALRGAEAAVERATSDLVRAEAELAKAIADKQRADDLRKSNAISAEEYLRVASLEKTAQAAKLQAVAGEKVAAATRDQAKDDLARTKIYSQFAGRISRTLVNPGNLVGYGAEPTQLTVMVQNDPIHVFFDIPEPEAIEYERLARETGLPAWSDGKIPLELEVDTESGYPHKGFINFRDPRYDVASGTVRVRATLDNKKRQLSSGMFARVRFPRGPEVSRLIVPVDAVLSDQRGQYVYVVKADNTVEARTVKTGQRIGAFVAIIDGLQAEDWVVVNGTQKARPKAAVVPEKTTLTPPPAEQKPTPKVESVPLPKG